MNFSRFPSRFLALALAALTAVPALPSFAQSGVAAAPISAVGNLRVASGFKAEMIYSVPRSEFGSWIGMCFDDKGRLIVSDQYAGLYRLTLPAIGSTDQVKVEPLDIDIGGAHGLLYAFGSLYVMVNERTPQGLYRVRDTDGDDKFDEVRVLRNIPGTGEHGTHSLTLSPDGQSIFVVVGNATQLTDVDGSRHPAHINNDNLLPNMTGFSDGQQPNGGYVLKTDKDGKTWELMNFGFRNPYDVNFNAEGELFAYDADMELDIGLPWYRPTRVMHLTSGADFGWRTLVNKWPAYYFDSMNEVANIGSGSPTGGEFGTGAKFPIKYQRAYYVSDWSWGKLYAVHMTPSGSSYTGTVEEFVGGAPFPVSDVVISPFDGAMYLTVGGRATQSALYRVTYVGTEPTTRAPLDLRGQSEREARRKLEAFHGVEHEGAVDAAWAQLGSQDRALRYAARLALEWQDRAKWEQRALAETNPRTAIAAIAALARVSTKGTGYLPQIAPKENPELQAKMLATLNKISWSGLSDADQADLIRAYTLVFTRTGKPTEATRKQLADKFDAIFPAPTKEVNTQLARMLVYLESPNAPAKIVAAMRTAPTQQEQIDYALQLRLQTVGWTKPLREEYFNWFIKAYANYRGGSAFLRGIVSIRTAALATISPAEKEELKEILAIVPKQVSPLQRVVDRPFVKDWSVNELTPMVEQKLAKGGRDFEAGRRLFGEVACAVCHAYGYEGGTVGPDLTGAVGRYSVRDLLEAIIEPSKVISDQFAATEFRMVDGSVITGRVANANTENITISQNMFDYTDTSVIVRANVVSMEDSATSMMPPGMINNLNDEQVTDLVAYLLSAGDRNGPVFKK